MSNIENSGEFHIKSNNDLLYARLLIRDKTTSIGYNLMDQTRIITATSELVRNILKFAETGVMYWKVIENGNRKGIQICFEDEGPGIPNIEQAMEKGYSTVNSLGLGLPGAKNLMDEFNIQSEVGKGTKIIIKKWLKS